MHGWSKACEFRASVENSKLPKHYFIESVPITITSTNYATFQVLKKLRDNTESGKQWRISYRPDASLFNKKISNYHIRFGPSHATMFSAGIKYSDYCRPLSNGNFKINIKYSKRCEMIFKNIKSGDNLVDITVSNKNEAKRQIIRGLIYLKGLEAGIP